MLGAKVILSLTLLGLSVATGERTERPNIIIFMADDLGYGDLHFTGHPTTSSPNLDKLASSSLTLNNFYVASPACSPSR